MAIKKQSITIKYHLKFLSPFHLGTGLPDGLIHRTVRRDKKGYLFIPGSAIKGVLRTECEKIAEILGLPAPSPHDERAALLCYKNNPVITERIFGSRYLESNLHFSNAYLIDNDKDLFKNNTGEKDKFLSLQVFKRAQNSISRLLGTAKEAALWNSEFGIPGLTFEGKIYGYLEGLLDEFSEPPVTYELTLLIAGLYAIEQIGANRSTGAGIVKITDNTTDSTGPSRRRFRHSPAFLLVFEN